MALPLYLCEKPSQARDIAQILGATTRREGYLEGNSCRVTWCLGHLLEMVMPEAYRPEWKSWQLDTLPILPGQWQLTVRPTVAKQFAVIQKLLPQSREVIIATDADREGETIGREVLTQCGYRGAVSRLWLSALDAASIRKALQNIRPGQQTEPLYQAGLGRARADWLVGINLSRAYTLLGRRIGHDGVLTVGRVQTPTLKLVVERDRIIETFRPIAFFTLVAEFQTAAGHFRARWIPDPAIADPEGRCLEREMAEAVARQIQGATGRIQDTTTRRMNEPPPLPFDLSTLQQEASRRWGFSAAQTLERAQALYETHKAITYPRTDCRHLPVSQWTDGPEVLRAITQADPAMQPLVQQANPALRSRAWDDKKITAHHAIIPTGSPPQLARLSGEEMRLYDLIRRHYLAQFFPAFLYDQTVIELRVETVQFRATGRVEVAPGWHRVVQTGPARDPVGEQDEESALPLPPVKPGEPAQVTGCEVAEKRTQPPHRFTEGTLIQAMKQVGKTVENPRLKKILRETAGIGTEATRGAIIENLLKRHLLAKEGKKGVISTATGRMLVDLLPHSVTDPATTAVWEQALEDIANGQAALETFQEKTVVWVTRLVSQVKARYETMARPEQTVRPRPEPAVSALHAGQLCPNCTSGHLVQRTASQGKNRGHVFLGCSRFPECRYTGSTEK